MSHHVIVGGSVVRSEKGLPPAGEIVGAGEADRRRSETLPEGLAVPTLCKH